MLIRAANIMTNFLEKKGAINPCSREVYLYGCEAALYTMLSTSGLLIIGVLFQCVLETAILVGLFYLNQSLGGGFHASTHMRCFVTMVAGLLCALAACNLQIEQPFLIVLVLLSTTILLCFPLVLHTNKQYLKYKTSFFVKRSRTTACVQAIAFFIILFLPYSQVIHSFAHGLLLCAISRSVAVIRLRKQEN